MQYKPELDGLRAVAVLAVALFHAGVPWMTGGFVGVDIFFVLSGYLITGVILDDIDAHKFSLLHFWERRIRRIVPALLTCALIAVVLGLLFLLPFDLLSLARSFRYLAISSTNILFWRETGYFGFDSNQVPLLHTWSLSVEEQFYICTPPMLMALTYFLSRKVTLRLVALGLIMSLALSIVMLDRSRWGTFYLLPPRAWELLVGSLLAGYRQRIKVTPIIAELSTAMGLVIITWTTLAYDESTPFPAHYAIPPVIGALLVILGATSSAQEATYRFSFRKFLRLKPVVFIGLVSYSFYLMHWPFLVCVRYISITEPPLTIRLGAITASLAAAALMYAFIEQPFRKNRTVITRGRVFAGGLFGMLLLYVTSEFIRLGEGLPSRFSPTTVRYALAKGDAKYLTDLSIAAINAGNWIEIGKADGEKSLVVWGDSHAMAALPAFDEFLKEHGGSGVAFVRSSTPPVTGYTSPTVNDFADSMEAYNACVRKQITQLQIKHVVLVGFWNSYFDNAQTRRDFADRLTATVRDLVDEGINVSIVLQMPSLRFDAPRALAIQSLSIHLGTVEDLLTEAKNYYAFSQHEPDLERELEATGANLIRLAGPFTREDGKMMVEKDGVSLYRDSQHLSVSGAKIMLLPILESNRAKLLPPSNSR